MMPQMGGMGMMGPGSTYSAQRTMFTYTGIPGLAGGYAYPPGSHMTQFMDQINNTLANASMMPQMGGGRPPMGGMQPPMMGPPPRRDNGSGMMMQMMGMMIGMMLSKAAPLIKERINERRAANSLDTETSRSVNNEQHTGQNNVTQQRTLA